MDETDLKIFLKGAANYFQKVGNEPAEIGTPYLKDDNEVVVLDYSAVIGISGLYKGCVYFTAAKTLVSHLLRDLGETNPSEDLCADTVGEIANTIAGNAQQDLGAGFMISVPVVIKGSPEAVRFPKDAPTYVTPIIWHGNKGYLLICVGNAQVGTT